MVYKVIVLYFSLPPGCKPGYYKWIQGDTPCRECPPHSYGREPGALECTCEPGYYRGPSDEKSKACTRKLLFSLSSSDYSL